MLCRLVIRDFVLVRELALDFQPGFGALTGETGAGKSLLIDALAFVLGERAEVGLIRSGAPRAEVTAEFDASAQPAFAAWFAEQAIPLEAGEGILIRRVMEASGRSRALINGVPVTLQQVRTAGEWLLDIHGQHAHQSLLRADAQRQLLDDFGQLQTQARTVATAWREWSSARQALADAGKRSGEIEARRDILAYQIKALAELANDQADWGWQQMGEEQSRLAHASSLIELTQGTVDTLGEGDEPILSVLGRLQHRLQEGAALDARLQEPTDLLAAASNELSEALTLLRRHLDRFEVDPVRLAEIERRMASMLELARKHLVDPPTLPELYRQLIAEAASLADATDIAALEARVKASATAYAEAAAQLTKGRAKAAKTLAKGVSEAMQELALGGGQCRIALQPLEVEGSAHGNERVEFQISGLAGDDWRSLSKVVSGGELSRISLAIQVVTSACSAVPTLIFDEVDVGIGGGVAEVVGRLLAKLGEQRQVLCVTHLAQVAARASWQWQVSKEKAEGVFQSRVQSLDDAARIEEIARMLGGVEITERTRAHAAEMLQLA
ncbi:DNA repair protein RecN [Fluviibacter phosphoraccumulans]|uniref:DNA repair protein RecN n=1 Tax=Fluviibacter phosphoraccumulans TaxID=1751046 RepID=UPI0024E252E5|nr:DNA repair protein RecN [Fluviibacter phosphoraccumulans]